MLIEIFEGDLLAGQCPGRVGDDDVIVDDDAMMKIVVVMVVIDV